MSTFTHLKTIKTLSHFAEKNAEKNLVSAHPELRQPEIKPTTNFEVTANLTAEMELMNRIQQQEEYMELPDASAKKAFLIGQMDGNMLNLRLTRAIQSSEPVNIERLLPAIDSKSIYYKKGLKTFVLNKTFPLALKLFYESSRSRQERITFMDSVLNKLR